MRRSTGAIFRETRPETIMTSACLGEARKTSAPKRARSLRELVTFIISIAQQARPKVAGQSEDLRAQLISESRRVVSTSGSASAMTFSSPINQFQISSSKFQVRLLLTDLKLETSNLKLFLTDALPPQPRGARVRPNQARPSLSRRPNLPRAA